ncbi:thioredoxin-like domain-containing protein [Chitinophaga caseinilytica]|uniref:thioredoxin-like domain-containing protein n=1 Tax=Chitinophaga caseinilytica TaxID=2267521 RepID=UPI003C2F19A7
MKFTLILLIVISSSYLLAKPMPLNTISALKGFNLHCQFDGLPDKSNAYLITQDRDTVLTTKSKGDRFDFTGTLKQDGRFLFICFDSTVSKIPSKAIFIINSDIHINGKIGNREVQVKGSQPHEDYQNFHSIFKNKMDNYIKMIDSSDHIKVILSQEEAQNNRTDLVDSLKERENYFKKEIDSLHKICSTTLINWLSANESSMIAPYMLLQLNSIIGDEMTEKFSQSLSEEAKKSYYGIQLSISYSNNRTTENILQNKQIPNVKLIDTKGNTRNILDIIKNNKYTLIDCWASWCAPCREEAPHLKSIFEAYSPYGFSIIGISSDKNVAKWLKAIKEDDTKWLHFREDEMLSFSQAFGLTAIPAYLLLDEKGNLIAFDCAMSSKVKNFGGRLRGEELAKTLNAILKVQVRN